MPAQETSVMVALSELHRIESERVVTEREQEAERRRQEAERQRREQEERAESERHRLRVAEAEARLRVAEEVRAAEAVSRAHRIEAELRVVKAEKAVLSEQFFARPPVVENPDGLAFWRFACGAILVAAVMAVVGVFAWPKRPPPAPVVVAAAPLPPPVDQTPLTNYLDALQAKIDKLQKQNDQLAAKPVVASRKPAAQPVKKPSVNISSASVGECDDPLCGVTLKK